MRKPIRRILSLALSLAMLFSLLPCVGAEEPAMPEIPLPNGDFETGDATNWIISGLPSNAVRRNEYNTPNTSYTLNLWANDTEAVEIHAKYPVTLTAGTYHFSFFISGEGKDSNLKWKILAGDTVLAEAANTVTTVDWNVWNTITTDNFTLTETTEIVFDFGGTGPIKYWGDLDDLKLYGTGGIDNGPAEMEEIAIPNGDFEIGLEGWIVDGISGEVIDNAAASSANNPTNVLNLWASNEEAVPVSASYAVNLTAGTYKFSFRMDGANMNSCLTCAVVGPSGLLSTLSGGGTISTTGWDLWAEYETGEFTLTKDTEITFVLGAELLPAGYWGHLDDLRLFGTGALVKEETEVELEHDPTLAVEQVPGVDSDDFVRGADVSSYLSIVNSGAKFYDYEGNELSNVGFFQLLKTAGFNYVRLRVWNDPFDADGHGYGGGNCDLNAALQMGQWATAAGLKVLIDFHYSDFWADPGKQAAPKAWANLSIEDKADSVFLFTYESLIELVENGVDVGMVQIGNETNGKICGESSWANMAQIFSAGCSAVRTVCREKDISIKAAVHFTNPEKTSNMKGFADKLAQYEVDYDVFATSWYPYWHGTTSNLTSVLSYVANTYDKEVMVAETSWAWTLDDGDGHENTVRVGNNDANAAYAFSQQGQANELAAAAKAVRAVGSAGLGVFYWENAWIPVQYAYDANGDLDQDILNANKAKWEQFGSGWASSYAAEYDPVDAGRWFGGSAVDNQAMFDFQGKALDSLWTWEYMMVGTEDMVDKQVESIEEVSVSMEQGGTLTMPSTVKVTYNVGGARDEAVVWDETELAAVNVNVPGIYTVHGVITLSYELGTAEAVATVTVNSPNLLLNPSFELSDMSMYTCSGGSRTKDDPHSGSYSFHWYNGTQNDSSVDLSQTVNLGSGKYTFSLYSQGDVKGATDLYINVEAAGISYGPVSFSLAGWANWQHPELSFTIPKMENAADTVAVTVSVHLACGPQGWGTIDDLSLTKTYEPEPEPELPMLFNSITIGAELIVVYNFKAAAMEAFDSWYLEVEKLDAEGAVLETTRFGEGQANELTLSGSYWFAGYTGVTAKEMGVTIRAKLVGVKNGSEVVGEPTAASIRDYLLELLVEDQGGPALQTLAADLLNYGAAAQIYFGFDTDNLVNENLTEAQAAALDQFETKTEAPATKTNTPDGPTLYSSVSIMNRVILSLSALVRNAEGEVTISVTDPDSGEATVLPVTAVSASVFSAEFSEVSAENMRKEYQISALVDGVQTGTSLTWSVEGYIKALRTEGGEPEIALANALLIYGDSAAAYLSTVGN